jgi:aryl-alcohol dehydrogenase-like predicted oxidoreductase
MNNRIHEKDSHYYQLSHDLQIHRIINGMWQVAGGHGYIDNEMALNDMVKHHESGFTSWDLADIYGPAEDFVGQFRQRLSQTKGKEELDKVKALTKWVPQPGRITYPIAKENIQRSLDRMGVRSLDLLQFHWWDYNNPYYLDALKHLSNLREEGLIKHIGLTNFDTIRMEVMRDSDIPIVSNQVQNMVSVFYLMEAYVGD